MKITQGGKNNGLKRKGHVNNNKNTKKQPTGKWWTAKTKESPAPIWKKKGLKAPVNSLCTISF